MIEAGRECLYKQRRFFFATKEFDPRQRCFAQQIRASRVLQIGKSLQLRLCIIDQTSAFGHRGRDATKPALNHQFAWSLLSTDVKFFVSPCNHRLSTAGSTPLSRPPRPFVYETKPADLIQIDSLKLNQCLRWDKYVLLHQGGHCD